MSTPFIFMQVLQSYEQRTHCQSKNLILLTLPFSFYPFPSSSSQLKQFIQYSSPENKDKNHLNKSDSHQLFSRHYKTFLSPNYSERQKLHSQGFPEMCEFVFLLYIHLLFLEKQEDGRKNFHGNHSAASCANCFLKSLILKSDFINGKYKQLQSCNEASEGLPESVHRNIWW